MNTTRKENRKQYKPENPDPDILLCLLSISMGAISIYISMSSYSPQQSIILKMYIGTQLAGIIYILNYGILIDNEIHGSRENRKKSSPIREFREIWESLSSHV
jgi:hypothetical protein